MALQEQERCHFSTNCQNRHTHYMLLAHSDVLLCLQLHTVKYTQYMILAHADDLLCLQQHTVGSAHTVHASSPF